MKIRATLTARQLGPTVANGMAYEGMRWRRGLRTSLKSNRFMDDMDHKLKNNLSEATYRQLRSQETDFRLQLLRASTDQKSFAYMSQGLE